MQRNSHHKPLDVEDIARRHRRHVYRLVRRFAADEVEALDLTREVFLRVFLQRKDYGSESDFLVHLYRIAVNLCDDEEGKHARRMVRAMLTT